LGYPQGLKGEEIHLNSRLLMVAEVFDALATERVYKKAWSKEEIIQYYRETPVNRSIRPWRAL
jgi:HD-GYP domain-containing protein (c-di-GMP phosphodiesterase class II)